MIKLLIQEMRPKQWIKNLLLFAGLVFAHKLGDMASVARAIAGFIIFCALSGVVYIVNDLLDAPGDRQHPLKRLRPIAAGTLPARVAITAGSIIAIASLVAAFFMNMTFGFIATVYFVAMLLYSLRLKHVVVLDLMTVAMGFVLRAIAGVKVIELPGESIPVTPWFITCVMFLALFIVICKRRHEILLLSEDAINHRPVLEHYSTQFLDQMVSVATAATVISYALYVTLGVNPAEVRHGHLMIWTLPFVLFGIFRYLYLVYRRDEGGAPELLLLKDPSMLVNVVLWLISITVIFYA